MILNHLYNQLRTDELYNSLPSVSRGDQIEEHLVNWEQSNPDQLELIDDEGQFFGWKGVGAGKLNKFMDFFFIPAVHEYSEEEQAEGSIYLNELLNLTIRREIESDSKLKDFLDRISSEYSVLTAEDNEPNTNELSANLSERIKNFAPDCEVFIKYQPGEVKLLQTKYSTEIKEYGFQGPISYLGHGVQRSFFFTLLRYFSNI